MIQIPIFQIKEASRVYGDFAEKKAFTLNVDPSMILGSIAGGYAANAHYNKKKTEQFQDNVANRRIENNAYAQVENILRDLKIVFTPINVVYSVNGQVFEIIKTDEMTPHMRQAFLQKDAAYFRDILLNKINMELQLAEQAFAQRLLTANGYGNQVKEANYISKQEGLIKLAEEAFDSLLKTASTGLEDVNLQVGLSFDSFRPFSRAEFLFNKQEFEKVASIFDAFASQEEPLDISLRRLINEVNVGFLPDRVVYLWNGQLIEQMSLLQMNEVGYQAFQRKDKSFFIDLFKQHATEISQQMNQPSLPSSDPTPTEAVVEKEAQTDEEDSFKKEADSLEDVVDELVDDEFPVIERDHLSPFADSDVHPVVYDMILSERYGVQWALHELEAIFKQLEVDFNLSDGIKENPLNKMSILHTVSSPDHAMFLAPLTFEKFIRGVNSKSVLFEEFQGNLSFEEILFGLEIAKAYNGAEVFFEFHDNIAPYVAEELMKENVRMISSQLYDETNPSEKSFFDSVNGYLMRKWKDLDAQGLREESEMERQHQMTVEIVEIAEEILGKHAEALEVDDPYRSVEDIIHTHDLLHSISDEFKHGVQNMVKETVVSHLVTALFLEYKHRELEYTITKLQEEGVLRG